LSVTRLYGGEVKNGKVRIGEDGGVGLDGWMGGWKDNDDSRAYDSRLNLIESGNIYAVLSLQGHFFDDMYDAKCSHACLCAAPHR
jgi:hypothetical protein